ncbi:hypothetical protein [Streptomyces sp. NPDC005209]|uniref:hypothetical protein n=1 Tax=Streptomyces sp. NPDC005209 TaxID=3156715 RepID=UPI0033B20484
MSTFSHAPYLLVAGAALLCGLVHRRVAARKGPRTKIMLAFNAPTPLLSDLPALLKTTLAHLAVLGTAHALLPFPAVDGGLVVAVLIVTGLVIGLLGPAPLIAASALLFGPILADTGYTLALATPMIAGSLLLFALVRPERWRGEVAQLQVLATYGPSIQPPAPSQYVLAGLAVAAAAAPVVATALIPADLGRSDALLRWTCSVLVAVQLFSWQWSTRHQLRQTRNYSNLYLASVVAAGFGVAIVAGDMIEGAWTQHRWLTGWLGGLIITAVALLTWPLAKGEFSSVLVDGPLRVIRAALTSAAFPCFVGVCLRPSSGTVVATTILATAEALSLVAGRRRVTVRAMARGILAYMPRLAPGPRAYFFGPWLHDSIWRRPTRPDLTLVRTYSGMAVKSAEGNMIEGQAFNTRDANLRYPLTGVKALLWTSIATEALDQADREISRVPAAAVPKLSTALEAARADVNAARAVVFSTANRWPEVLAELRQSAHRYHEVGAPHRAAIMRALCAAISTVHLAQPRTGERTLDAIPGPIAQIPTIEYLGLVLRAHLAPPDSAERAARLAQADAFPPGLSRLNADAARDTGLPAWDEDLADGLSTLCRRLRNAVTVPGTAAVVAGQGTAHDEALVRVV